MTYLQRLNCLQHHRLHLEKGKGEVLIDKGKHSSWEQTRTKLLASECKADARQTPCVYPSSHRSCLGSTSTSPVQKELPACAPHLQLGVFLGFFFFL